MDRAASNDDLAKITESVKPSAEADPSTRSFRVDSKSLIATLKRCRHCRQGFPEGGMTQATVTAELREVRLHASTGRRNGLLHSKGEYWHVRTIEHEGLSRPSRHRLR